MLDKETTLAIIIALESYTPSKVVSMFGFNIDDVENVMSFKKIKSDMIAKKTIKNALVFREKGLKVVDIIDILSLTKAKYYYIIKHYNLDNFKDTE